MLRARVNLNQLYFFNSTLDLEAAKATEPKRAILFNLMSTAGTI